MKNNASLLILLLNVIGRHRQDVVTAFVSPITSSSRCEYTTTTTTTSLSVNKEASSTTSSYSPSASFDTFQATEIDASNTPPNLQTILTSLKELKSGSDLRGTYAAHANSGGTIANISHLIKQVKGEGNGAALTPFASHCFGVAFARWLLQHEGDDDASNHKHGTNALTICIGRDPRIHGERLADAFARGAESVDGVTKPVRVLYTGVTTTPSMYEFCRAGKCDAAIIITASHLPEDKNGIKFFSGNGGLDKEDIDELIVLAQEEATEWYNTGIMPPSSGNAGVLCSELVNFLPYYKQTLKQAIGREVDPNPNPAKPLSNLNIVVNPGNGSGSFFSDLLRELGANVAGSLHLTPDGTFPDTIGVPNPEKKAMVEETMRACEDCNADIGVMFDTDADRSGFVLPRSIDANGVCSSYEPLNKNRLIALLSVIFSSSTPGATVVTDSTTSEGLNTFLEKKLGLKHFRYLRGYANVINKAKELQGSEMAIETSGHCALRENGWIDDGTFTAVKIIALLANSKGKGSLLDLISELEEMPFDEEFRVKATDGSLETTTAVFESVSKSLKEKCNAEDQWTLDEDNLEGVRVRLSSGGFFMIRQSLHDPVISLQVESVSEEYARPVALSPLFKLFSEHASVLDLSAIEK